MEKDIFVGEMVSTALTKKKCHSTVNEYTHDFKNKISFCIF